MHCAVRKENSNVIISWLFKQNIESKKSVQEPRNSSYCLRQRSSKLETRIKKQCYLLSSSVIDWRYFWIVPSNFAQRFAYCISWRNLFSDCRCWCSVHIEMIFSQRKANRERLNPTNRTRNAPVKFFNVSGLCRLLSVGRALWIQFCNLPYICRAWVGIEFPSSR